MPETQPCWSVDKEEGSSTRGSSKAGVCTLQTAHLDQKLLVWFFYVGVEALIALGCALNQMGQDLQKEVVSVRLALPQMLNSGAVHLVRMRTKPKQDQRL